MRVLAAWTGSSRLGIEPNHGDRASSMTPDRHSTVPYAYRSIGSMGLWCSTELGCCRLRGLLLLLECIHAASAGAGSVRLGSDLHCRSPSPQVCEGIQRAGSLHILARWVCERAALAPRPPEEPFPHELPPSCSPPWPTVNWTDHPEECPSMRAPPQQFWTGETTATELTFSVCFRTSSPAVCCVGGAAGALSSVCRLCHCVCAQARQ